MDDLNYVDLNLGLENIRREQETRLSSSLEFYLVFHHPHFQLKRKSLARKRKRQRKKRRKRKFLPRHQSSIAAAADPWTADLMTESMISVDLIHKTDNIIDPIHQPNVI